MSTEFAIHQAESPGAAAVLRISGRLDARNAQMLMKRCQDLLAAGRTRVVLNLSEISFVASSGIGSLLALTESFQDANGSLHLVGLSDAVASVVDLLNLRQFLRIDGSEADALQSIGA